MRFEVVTHGADRLGECPVWLAAEQTPLRVDITGRAIVTRDVATGAEHRQRTDGPVGFALPTTGDARAGRALRASGDALVAGSGQLATGDALVVGSGQLATGDALVTGIGREVRVGSARLAAVAAIDFDLDRGGLGVRRTFASIDAEIRLPVTNPTSLAFGGADLGDLYVTSAKHRLSPEQLAREPLAGSLPRLRPGVRGRLPHRFGDD